MWTGVGVWILQIYVSMAFGDAEVKSRIYRNV
jgi:hypothetical protein